jgi:hypothetical protein
MRASQKKFEVLEAVRWILILSLIIAPLRAATAQQEKKAASKDSITGKYEGTAKNNAQDIIQVTFELTEKDGTMSGMIRSDHGDFTIGGGTHKGDDVTLEFDANGANGTINLKLGDGRLSGTWSAGEDGGPVEVKRVVAQEAPKEKS